MSDNRYRGRQRYRGRGQPRSRFDVRRRGQGRGQAGFSQPNLQRANNRMPGTSTLSLPGLHSSFPGNFAPQTPSYSMDLCRINFETAPNSNVFYHGFVNIPVRDVVSGIVQRHGFRADSQEVEDYRSRVAGNPPSATVRVPEEEEPSDKSLEEQKEALIKEYKDSLITESYFRQRAVELGSKLNIVENKIREQRIAAGGGKLVIKLIPPSEIEKKNQTCEVKQETTEGAEAQESAIAANREEKSEADEPDIGNDDKIKASNKDEQVVDSPTSKDVTPKKDKVQITTGAGARPKGNIKFMKTFNFWENKATKDDNKRTTTVHRRGTSRAVSIDEQASEEKEEKKLDQSHENEQHDQDLSLPPPIVESSNRNDAADNNQTEQKDEDLSLPAPIIDPSRETPSSQQGHRLNFDPQGPYARSNDEEDNVSAASAPGFLGGLPFYAYSNMNVQPIGTGRRYHMTSPE